MKKKWTAQDYRDMKREAQRIAANNRSDPFAYDRALTHMKLGILEFPKSKAQSRRGVNPSRRAGSSSPLTRAGTAAGARSPHNPVPAAPFWR